MTHASLSVSEHSARAGVRAPELCRLTIVAQHTQVDLALPAEVPVALLIPGIVDLVAAHGRTNEFDHAVEQSEPSEWVLARVGQSPLSATLSLSEHGVRDGELLMLESAQHGAPQPLFDDIMYSVAAAGAESNRQWTPDSARLMGSVSAVFATLAGCFALLWDARAADDLLGAICALVLTVLFVAGGSVVGRVYQDTRSALVLGGCALPTAVTGGFLLVPDDVSWAHALMGTALAGAMAVTALRMSNAGLRLFTAATTIAVLLIPAELVGTLSDQPVQAIAAVLAGVALAAIAGAPRISMMLASLPLPGVPSPGSEATTDDDDAAALSFLELRERAAAARRSMSGIIIGATIVSAAAAITAAATGGSGIDWPATTLAATCAAVLMFRGRTYAAAEQAFTLIAGGLTVILGLLIDASLTAGYPLAVFGVAVVGALLALVLGIIAPNQTFSPPLRRAAELAEYACVAAVVPLVCWVAELYSLVRGL
ncbi:type VII secretion integral membrane protein EccD [Aldersonia kunmingensis]|uniref:type VII secretion integral membrane protein EccD n=1 Tax=Aldersonia kunmingensis TaxID=408066 RepID=UPI00082FEECD|nr:type VII secretion integral membrane protein EccD [Aldersonia kunmingensis]